MEEYKKLYREVWSLKDEFILYLEIDLLTFKKVVEKANKGFLFSSHLVFKWKNI